MKIPPLVGQAAIKIYRRQLLVMLFLFPSLGDCDPMPTTMIRRRVSISPHPTTIQPLGAKVVTQLIAELFILAKILVDNPLGLLPDVPHSIQRMIIKYFNVILSVTLK